ncbi:DUF4286 family protein [Crocinitomix catalasitica]|uniref:DUF4286 family protein n=1 Tax=Crocinitomix catalasitica TaxID=184607 RepID=UPI0004862525|nr:DUF4286 family protein [Crocinitomix catalasitica]
MNVLYNVTVSVDKDVSDEWLEWMETTHIPEVIKTGFFIEAKLSQVLSDDEGSISFAVQYLCESMIHYEEYKILHAERLQKEHTDKYGYKTAAFRSLLLVKSNFSK